MADVIDIAVNIAAAAVVQGGFRQILIAGQNAPAAAIPENTSKVYGVATFADEMATDGWSVSDAEYKAVAAIAAQAIRPPDVRVGHVPAPVAQVSNIQFTTTTDGIHEITVEVAGKTFGPFSINPVGQTIAQKRDAMKAQLDGNAELLTYIATASVSTDQITITSANAGQAHTVTKGGAQAAGITLTVPTPNVGYQTALTAISIVTPDVTDQWYGLYGVDDASHHIVERAVFAESNRKFHHANTTDANSYSEASTTDVGAYLKARSYKRTLVAYHAQATEHMACAWLGNRLGVDADVESCGWPGVTLAGVTPSVLTAGQKAVLVGKNISHYSKLGGVGATHVGKMAGGLWADNILAADWFKARLTENHQRTYLEYANAGKKLRGDAGINVIEGDYLAIETLGFNLGHLDPGIPGDPENPVPDRNFPSQAERTEADIVAREYNYTSTVSAGTCIFNVTGTVTLLER